MEAKPWSEPLGVQDAIVTLVIARGKELPLVFWLFVLRFIRTEDLGALQLQLPKKLKIFVSTLSPSALKLIQCELWFDKYPITSIRGGSVATLTSSNRPSPLVCIGRHSSIELKKMCFASSLVWQRQQAFYMLKGNDAWSKNLVPNQISTNAFVAEYYLSIIARQIYNDVTAGVFKGGCYNFLCVELGAGHGALSMLMATIELRKTTSSISHRLHQHLTSLSGGGPALSFPVTVNTHFVATDFHPSVFRSMLSSVPGVGTLCQEGYLSFAIAAADDTNHTPAAFVDIDGVDIVNKDWCKGGVLHRACVVANYAFDSFPCDLYVKSPEGKLFELGVRGEEKPARTAAHKKEKRRRRRQRKAAGQSETVDNGGGGGGDSKRKRQDDTGGVRMVETPVAWKMLDRDCDDDITAREDKQVLRALLQSCVDPTVLAVPWAGLRLLRRIVGVLVPHLQVVPVPGEGEGARMIMMLVGDRVLEGDDELWMGRVVGMKLDASVDSTASDDRSDIATRAVYKTSGNSACSSCFELPHISPSPDAMAVPISQAVIRFLFHRAISSTAAAPPTVDEAAGAVAGSAFTVLCFSTVATADSSSSISGLPCFGPAEFQSLRDLVVCPDYRHFCQSWAPPVWLEYLTTVAKHDFEVFKRCRWAMFRSLLIPRGPYTLVPQTGSSDGGDGHACIGKEDNPFLCALIQAVKECHQSYALSFATVDEARKAVLLTAHFTGLLSRLQKE